MKILPAFLDIFFIKLYQAWTHWSLADVPAILIV